MKSYVRRARVFLLAVAFSAAIPVHAANRIIMLTGYWPPTNEMLRPFSQNQAQNPGGWKGADWENSGFDVRAYFPEFPAGSGDVGVGDFRVDYDATRADHAKYTALLKPVALIGFGNGPGPWTIEVNFPDYWNGTNYVGHSTLPVEAIQKAVNADLGAGTASINTNGNPGDFLCGYMSMLNAQYDERHRDAGDPDRVLAAGFIHVSTDVPSAVRASEDTLRALITYLKAQGQ